MDSIQRVDLPVEVEEMPVKVRPCRKKD